MCCFLGYHLTLSLLSIGYLLIEPDVLLIPDPSSFLVVALHLFPDVIKVVRVQGVRLLYERLLPRAIYMHFLSRVKDALKVGRDFVTRGARRLVELFKGRWSVERLFGRAKEWLLLGCLKFRGLEQAAIHTCLSFTAMLTVAGAAVDGGQPGLIRSIKHFTV